MGDDLQYSTHDEDGKVICQICGKSYKVVSVTHLKSHGITMKQYRMRYPTAAFVSENFKIKQKYAKTGIMEEPETKEPVIAEELSFPEEVLTDEGPSIEEFYANEIKEATNKPGNPIRKIRDRIIEHLQTYFPHTEENYLIQKLNIEQHLLYETITDFCDPVMKVDIEFPDVFWHNTDVFPKARRNETLKNDGWRVFIVKGKAPTSNDIDEVIKGKN